MDDTEDTRPVWEQLPPIRALPNTCYIFEDKEFYHVGKAVAEILANPSSFAFGTILPEKLVPQLEGQGNIDFNYVASLSDEDAARPILMIRYPNGAARIIDGHHRATRAIQRGAPMIGVWLLTPEQTQRIRLDAATVKALGLATHSTIL